MLLNLSDRDSWLTESVLVYLYKKPAKYNDREIGTVSNECTRKFFHSDSKSVYA